MFCCPLMARNKMMFTLKTMLLLVFMLYISNTIFVKAEDGSSDSGTPPYLCLNCTDCSNPCRPFPPPPPYPIYAPPPPSPLCQGCGAPPPPSPVECPPTPVRCCQIPPPQGSGSANLPYYNYSSSPPFPTFHRLFNAFLSILLFCHFAL